MAKLSPKQSEILAAIFWVTKRNPASMVTLATLKEELAGKEENQNKDIDEKYISKIISSIRALDKSTPNKVIITTVSQGKKGFLLNTASMVSSSLTARIFLELRHEATRLSIPVEEFKKKILESPFFLSRGGTEAILMHKLMWGVSTNYLQLIGCEKEYLTVSPRTHEEAYFLELIQIKDE